MLVNQTIALEESYSFLYNLGIPLRGMKEVTGFVDNITGETGSRYFYKEFRYAMNGVKWSKWFELTGPNLIAQLNIDSGSIPIKNDVRLELRYRRTGATTTGTLTLDDVTINGLYNMSYLQTLDFQGTVYKGIAFTDEYWNRVSMNLLEKLYEKGIVPEYIKRGDLDIDDADYVEFFKAIAMWYGLTIALGDKVLTNMNSDDLLLAEYLRQRSLFLCGDESIAVLQYLAQNIYDEIRKRGTRLVHTPDGDHLNPVANPAHGEILRMICFNIEDDEYLWEYTKGGWYVDTNSPTDGQLTNHMQLNKMPENTADFISLAGFDNVGTVNIVTDAGKEVAEIAAGDALKTFDIKVDPKIAYEIRFLVNDPTPTADIDVNVTSENIGGFAVDLKDAELGTARNYFVQSMELIDGTPYYFYRGYIFPYNEPALSNADASIDIGGKHLKFGSSDTSRIVLEILNNSGAVINIHDIKMIPMKYETNPASVDGIDKTIIWMKNRNGLFTDTKLEREIEEYLIPAKSGLLITKL